ncbi:hypothetical protein J3E69DRAFT_334008, partial [Trichoderma sp. SZMC 28015]
MSTVSRLISARGPRCLSLIMTLSTPAASLLAICRIHEKGTNFKFNGAACAFSLSYFLNLSFCCSACVRGRRLAARIAEA